MYWVGVALRRCAQLRLRMSASKPLAMSKRIVDNVVHANVCSMPLYDQLCCDADVDVDEEERENVAKRIGQFQMYVVGDLIFASRVRYERFLVGISSWSVRTKAVAIRRLWKL